MKWAVLAFLCTLLAGCTAVTPAPIPPDPDYNEILPNGSPVTAIYTGNDYRCSATRVDARIYLTARHCIDVIGSAGSLINWGGKDQDVSELDDAWASDVADIAVLLAKRTLPAEIGWARFATESYRGAGYIEGYGCKPGEVFQRQLRFAYIQYDKSGYLGVYGKVCGGDSGGALLNDSGSLMGILVSSWNIGGVGIVSATEISLAKSGLKQMLNREISQNM